MTSFGPELEALAKIEQVVEQGEEFMRALYASRSVSRAIPMVRGPSDTNRVELNLATYEALKPVADRLLALLDFQTNAIEVN